MSRSIQSGFTLVELFMTLVLASLLAVSARALFLDQSSVTPMLVEDQLISSTRLAQQAALARSDSAAALTISQQGTGYRFTLIDGAHTSVRDVPGDGTTLTWSTGSLAGSCSPVTGTLPRTLSFDRNGDTTPIRFCISGRETRPVCVSALGFAYAGNCDT